MKGIKIGKSWFYDVEDKLLYKVEFDKQGNYKDMGSVLQIVNGKMFPIGDEYIPIGIINRIQSIEEDTNGKYKSAVQHH